MILCQMERKSSLNEPWVRSKLQSSPGGIAMSHPSSMELLERQMSVHTQSAPQKLSGAALVMVTGQGKETNDMVLTLE